MTSFQRSKICVSTAILTAIAGALASLISMVAHAAPASQPAGLTVGAWLSANAVWLVPLVSVIVATAVTAMTKYVPKATGLISFLQVVGDVLSLWGHRDSPTGANFPGRRSEPPR